MKLIIAGSRNIKNPFDVVVNAFMKSHYRLEDIYEIVSGGSGSIDKAGEEFATTYSFYLKVFDANWDKYGKSAGPIRNEQMAEYADALLSIWDGKSRGTLNMINMAHKNGLDIFVHMVKERK